MFLSDSFWSVALFSTMMSLTYSTLSWRIYRKLVKIGELAKEYLNHMVGVSVFVIAWNSLSISSSIRVPPSRHRRRHWTLACNNFIKTLYLETSFLINAEIKSFYDNGNFFSNSAVSRSKGILTSTSRILTRYRLNCATS